MAAHHEIRRTNGRKADMADLSSTPSPHSRRDAAAPVNLDFDARIPIPFSVFPSSYRSDAVTTETTTVEAEGQLPARSSRVGREGHETTRYSSYEAELPARRKGGRRTEEDVHIYEEERRRPGRRTEEDVHIYEEERRRPGRREEDVRKEDIRIYEERRPRERRFEEDIEVSTRERYREPYRRYAESQIEVEDRDWDREREFPTTHGPATRYAESELDVTERDYRQRTRPGAAIAETYTERDYYAPREEVRVSEETRTTVDAPRHQHHRDMGYYDEDGHYHSFRHGLRRAADHVLHPIHGPHHHHHHHHSRHGHDHHDHEDEVVVDRVERTERVVDRERFEPERISSSSTTIAAPSAPAMPRYTTDRVAPNTITIPCHHIRIGDLLILQGRPCQVIRITTSAQTGQHRYLGVDLFTKQLHEESSFVSHPSPSVVVQNMLGPVFKQYRVLDIRDDGRVVAMTETGDVKQGLPVIDQSGLHARLRDSFDNGRGSIRVLVINDEGRELAVDYKIVHGSRL
ncbi:MAG: hypothetical protein M1820_003071 [Bogoriella megaspora]|nr:MAG: hypothetical protein M1820_003071 [Bogoriella megaspora]